GTSQYIQVPHSASLNFNGEVTVCAWINPFVVNVEQQAICGKGGGWWRTGWLLTLNNDKVRWHLGNGNTEDEGMFDSQLSIPANEWSFIVGLWKDGVMNVYINGILDPKSDLWADGLVSTTSDMYIGKTDQPDFDFFFNGYIDDVRIYNRALTADEIRELYHEGDWSTVTDIDGNVYPTVKIGEQEWMAENLRTTKYNDYSDIPTGYTDGDWAALTTGAYAIYPYTSIDGLNSDAEVLEAYGALYNWYAVNDSKGICPTGWKVPSDTEWTTLLNYAGGQTVAGGKLKSTRTYPDSHPRWDSPNVGATDEYGFSAFPGGTRDDVGGFGGVGYFFNTWTSTQSNQDYAYRNVIYVDSESSSNVSTTKPHGFSIRCIKGTGAQHAELPYYQTFDNDLGDCYTYSVSGDTKFWNHNSDFQNAQMNGYNSGELEEDWLILPSVTLNYDGYYLSFDTWRRYGSDDSNNFLSLQYSTDYSGSGDPNAANWTELSFEPPTAEQVVTNSGFIDLSGIAGEKVYFAFRYYYNTGYVWWEVDNIRISSDLPPQVSTLPVENFYITPRAAKAGGSIS
ncbi:MAG TPA: FISUMP domain-containing protein, partial [Tenuifilaceae bacterium]|nr:FISUMP domain-containing protein [Tenuifilaceae bacterium]